MRAPRILAAAAVMTMVLILAIAIAHCLTQNVTGQLLADECSSATKLVRWPLWRERSAWARGARSCRR